MNIKLLHVALDKTGRYVLATNDKEYYEYSFFDLKQMVYYWRPLRAGVIHKTKHPNIKSISVKDSNSTFYKSDIHEKHKKYYGLK